MPDSTATQVGTGPDGGTAALFFITCMSPCSLKPLGKEKKYENFLSCLIDLEVQPKMCSIPAFSRFGKITIASVNSEFLPLSCNEKSVCN